MNLIRFFPILILSSIHCSEAYFLESENTEGQVCSTGWVPYKDERCLKIFETDFKNYAEAESLCKENLQSHLISVEYLEKQEFIKNLLKSKELTENLWIGLKDLGGDKYGWSDSTQLAFTNWNTGHPSKDQNLCTQIAQTSNFKWERAPCTNENLVICETVQRWSPEQMQIKMMNTMRNIVPLDFIYVQLPKHKSPAEIWPWMGWEDVSKEYDSLFFRVIGEASGEFKEVQEGYLPTFEIKISRGEIDDDDDDDDRPYPDPHPKNSSNEGHIFGVPIGDWTEEIYYQPYGKDQLFAQMKQTRGDVTPRNMAMRIWKRKY